VKKQLVTYSTQKVKSYITYNIAIQSTTINQECPHEFIKTFKF